VESLVESPRVTRHYTFNKPRADSTTFNDDRPNAGVNTHTGEMCLAYIVAKLLQGVEAVVILLPNGHRRNAGVNACNTAKLGMERATSLYNLSVIPWKVAFQIDLNTTITEMSVAEEFPAWVCATESGDLQNQGRAMQNQGRAMHGHGIGMACNGMAWHGHGRAWHDTAWHGVARPVHGSMAWHGMARAWHGHGMAWHGTGMAWHGMASLARAWHGMARTWHRDGMDMAYPATAIR
jgi:hypothetical protein